MLKMKIGNYEFIGETYSELLQNVWGANTYNAPLEVLKVCEAIQTYVVDEFYYDIDVVLKNENCCKDIVYYIKVIKLEFRHYCGFEVEVTGNEKK